MRTIPDPIRGKNVARTPEEVVRQGLVRLLTGSLGIPATCLRVELSLSRIDSRVHDRIDVAAFHRDRAVLLCECKAPDVPLAEEVSAQLRRYLRLLPAHWVLATNGHDFRLHRLEAGTWVACSGLYGWDAMKALSGS